MACAAARSIGKQAAPKTISMTPAQSSMGGDCRAAPAKSTRQRRRDKQANAALDSTGFPTILKNMLNYQSPLDTAFKALSDTTRRAILERLSRGPASVRALAEPLPMSLPAVHPHLQVLEESGQMEWEKRGRVRWCRLDGMGLAAAEDWVLNRRATWERRLEALAAHLARDVEKGSKP